MFLSAAWKILNLDGQIAEIGGEILFDFVCLYYNVIAVNSLKKFYQIRSGFSPHVDFLIMKPWTCKLTLIVNQ